MAGAGIVAINAFDPAWKVSKFLYYSLLGLQHRGQEEAVAYIYDGSRIRKIYGKGLVDEALKGVEEVPGYAGIGAVYTRTPGLHAHVSHRGVEVAVCVDGAPSEGPEAIAKIIAEEVAAGKDALDAALAAASKVRGAYSFVALTSKGDVLAYRGAPGLKPLAVGGFGFDMAIYASESSAFDVIGAEIRRDLFPGEAFRSNLLVVDREHPCKCCDPILCSFEYVYFARPDSVVDGIEIYQARYEMGRLLAKRSPAEVDAVVGVPETAIPFSLGYARELGVEVHTGFIATGRKARTAIKPDMVERLIGIQLKLNPIRSVFKGKRVAVIDDSVVRGTTLKTVIHLLRNKIGAREVHVRIGSPRLIAGCPFGAEVPGKDELIAAHLSPEEAAMVIGADSMNWLALEDLSKALGRPLEKICTGCFTERYPNVG